MAIYKNDYSKKEDESLWELHEARHELFNDLKNKSIKEINSQALNKFKNWKKQKDKVVINIENSKRSVA